jgi:anaerobic magnesium-protoporphyrin IX monomethyl ester cyclase
VRLRSVDSVVGELKSLWDSVRGSSVPGANVVKFLDDTFTNGKKRTAALLDEIIRNNLKFEFTGGVRADTLDEQLASKMAEAGFRRVTLGVESGSSKILDLIRKGETNEDVKRALGLLRKAGIRSHAFFMIGFPGETREDIELSKKLILDCRPDYIEVNMLTPYPGTDLFRMLVSEDPERIQGWYRWFHQGFAVHSDKLGFDLDRAYREFSDFAKEYNRSEKEADY